MVPEGWFKTILGSVVEAGFRNGYSPNPPEVPTDRTVLSLSALTGNGFNKTAVKPAPNNELVLRTELKQGDFLISRANTRERVGFSAVFPGEVPRCSYPDLMMRFRPNQRKITPNYLEQALRSRITLNYLQSAASGTSASMVKLTSKTVAKAPILLPPLPEQQKIAEILSTWDRAIEVSEALLATAQTQKRALMQSLLTGKRRFPEFEGQPWKEVRLGDVAQISMGSSPKSSAYNQDGIGLPLIQGNADIKNGWSAPRSFTSETTTICKPNDILLSVRAPVGTIAISGHHACVGRGAAVITPKAGYSWSWLKHVMIDLNPKWVRVSQGSTFDAVNSKDIKSFKIMAPSSLKEQDRIGEAMEVTEWEINSLTDQISKLRTEKKALTQQLLTGKRRVVV